VNEEAMARVGPQRHRPKERKKEIKKERKKERKLKFC
jgi:hypothetical protein